MLISNISDVLGFISVSSVSLNYVNESGASMADIKNNKLMEEIKDSTNQIKRETLYINETKRLPPATPEFIKHLNILY
jgi:hypothetical protein